MSNKRKTKYHSIMNCNTTEKQKRLAGWNKLTCVMSTCAMMVTLFGCGGYETYDTFEKPKTVASTLKPVDSYETKEVLEYTKEGVKEEPIAVVSSEDGICTIQKMPSYIDVTLDYEKGTRYQVGTTYAKTILEFYPEYEIAMEPYIFENIRCAFSGDGYSEEAVEKRMMDLYKNLPEEYQQELDGFATEMAKGVHGFQEDGKISYEEAIITQMIPDTLRPTSCSALSLWGERTKSGKPITLRCMEWNLGSENQIANVNAVTHMVNGDKCITSISMLGVLDILTAVNQDGVFVGILDVGSTNGETFVSEGKMSYTFAIRWALEQYDNATDVGNYMVEHSGQFTWCHNLMITDAHHSYCAEDCVQEVADKGDGFSVLRDADTPLIEGLQWENKDSLCVVNSFVTKGNQDGFSGVESNVIRFAKYNKWVKEQEQFDVLDVKNMITSEQTNQYEVTTIHRLGEVHIVIVDYETGNVQVAFTGAEGVVDKPIFVDVGNVK